MRISDWSSDVCSSDLKVHDVRNYIKKGKLWEAFESEQRVILLIDEIDKADIEFPNDLLQELDKMEFYIYETNETIKAKQRPIIIITSNNERSEEHTSELQSLMRISYAVFCLKKKKK